MTELEENLNGQRELGTHYNPGDAIFYQGDEANSLYVIQKGSVELVYETATGSYQITTLEEGAIFGEISLFADRTRFLTARALVDSRIIRIDQKTFIGKLHHDPSLAFRVIRKMAQRIYELDHQLMQRLVEDDDQRRDQLTGLPEYSNVETLLEQETNRASRLQQSVAFAIIDVDNIGEIRQKYGTEAGELVLKTISELLRRNLRRTDIIGRTGNDRFPVLFFESDGATSFRLIEKIRKTCARVRLKTRKDRFKVTFSCGIAVYPNVKTAVGLREAAYRALKQAKEGGRNRTVLHGAKGDEGTGHSITGFLARLTG